MDQDTKAKFIQIMKRCNMTVGELAQTAKYSPNYVHNLIYDKKGNAPRWMVIVVWIVGRLDTLKKDSAKT